MTGLSRTTSMYDKTFETHWPANVNGLTPEMFAAHLFNRTHNPVGLFLNRVTVQADNMRDLINLIRALRDYADTYNGHWYRAICRVNRSDETSSSNGPCLCPSWRRGTFVPSAPAFDQIKMALINAIPILLPA